MPKKFVWAIALGSVLTLGAGATVLAAGPTSNTTAFNFVNDLASHLGISTTTLNTAVKQTEIDRVNALLKAGKITSTQAQKMETGINSGPVHLNAGPEGHFRGRGMRMGFMAFPPEIAKALGLTPQTLMKDLQSGQTLGQIITAQGKTASAIEATLQAQLKTKLDSAVSSGKMTSAQETTILNKFATNFQNMLTKTWPANGPHRGWMGPMKGTPPPNAPTPAPGTSGTSGA